MASTDRSIDVDHPVSVLSFVLLGTIGVLSFIVQPALVQGFVTALGRSEAEAVMLAGAEMAGIAIASIFLAAFGSRIDWRQVTLAGLAVAALGDLASAWQSSGEYLAPARFFAGLGHGAIVSISFTFVGLTRRTDRNLALYLMLLLSYGAFGIWYGPTLFDAIGMRGVFSMFAIITAASLATIPFLPRSARARVQPSSTVRTLPLASRAIALAGVLAYNMAQGVAWANLFLIGTDAGIGEQAVADALFVSQIAAVAGALAALFVPGRLGREAPILFGIAAGGACIVPLYGRPSADMFTLAVCGFNLLWNFTLPFILAAIGDMDARGQMIAQAIALQMTGLWLGPTISALLIGSGDFTGVKTLCMLSFAASLILLIWPLRAYRRVPGAALA
jgi:predicted MFS family arabinose efflux permease